MNLGGANLGEPGSNLGAAWAPLFQIFVFLKTPRATPPYRDSLFLFLMDWVNSFFFKRERGD